MRKSRRRSVLIEALDTDGSVIVEALVERLVALGDADARSRS